MQFGGQATKFREEPVASIIEADGGSNRFLLKVSKHRPNCMVSYSRTSLIFTKWERQVPFLKFRYRVLTRGQPSVHSNLYSKATQTEMARHTLAQEKTSGKGSGLGTRYFNP